MKNYRPFTALAILMMLSCLIVAQTSKYASYVGTYNLKVHKNDSGVIVYDYIKLDYKNGKFECYRAYKFKDVKTGKESNETKHYYEIVNLDAKNNTITIKMDNSKATYNLVQNKSGGYDLVVYDKILIYTCKK
jgi:hypothetical protein